MHPVVQVRLRRMKGPLSLPPTIEHPPITPNIAAE